MTDKIQDQPDGATPLDDISGLLREEITTRKQLDEAETFNILNAAEWIERGRLGDVLTVDFYARLHARMFDEVWAWAGTLRSVTRARPNLGVAPEMVPAELGRVAMEYNKEWGEKSDQAILPFVARYHHALVLVHPFNDGNGRWSRLACDAFVKRVAKEEPLTWASDTLSADSNERARYITALKNADQHNYEPLVEYLAALNPDR